MKLKATGLLLVPAAVVVVACGSAGTANSANDSAPALTTSVPATSAPPPTFAPLPTATVPSGPPCHFHFEQGQVLPDPKCTPGAVLTTSVADVCSPDWASNHREEFSKTARERAYAKYGIITTDPAGYGEYDHLIPLELGGSNSSSNLWPEAGKIPNAKDQIENALHAAVCSGHASLRLAQQAIASDWPVAGTKVIEVGSGLKSAPKPEPAMATTKAVVAPAPKPTTAPPPPATTSAPAPVTTTAVTCSPQTSGGNCYKAGEFCPKADHNASGTAGNGEAITCEDSGGWRWEAS